MTTELQRYRVVRGAILARTFSFTVSASKFRQGDFGLTRLDVARKLLTEMGLDVEGMESMQVVPHGDQCTVICRG